MNTRRQFLITAPMAVLVTATACPQTSASGCFAIDINDGWSAANVRHWRGAGPPVTAETFAEAEKLMQVTMTARGATAGGDTWRTSLGAVS
jgi:hypothetical protein